jgi:hypothetical protein
LEKVQNNIETSEKMTHKISTPILTEGNEKLMKLADEDTGRVRTGRVSVMKDRNDKDMDGSKASITLREIEIRLS